MMDIQFVLTVRVIIFLSCSLAPNIAAADTIFFETKAVHGRIINFDREAVTVAAGCNAGDEMRLAWGDVRQIVFNERCGVTSTRIPSAGGGVCTSTPRLRFLIHLKHNSQPIVADGVQFGSDRILHYSDEAALTTGHGPISDIRGISYEFVCPESHSQTEPPASFCIEPTQFAVNFSYETPLENKIFTRGFSFHLELVGQNNIPEPAVVTEIQETIRKSFGTALNSWVYALFIRRDAYDQTIKDFIETMISRSEAGYVLITPPQVIALQCPHAATFVVRVFFERGGPFAKSATKKAAFAQKPGRTVLLNYADYQCWSYASERFVLDPDTRCLNPVPILAHELGHAFGLGHTLEQDSIMAGIISVPTPSARDADRLVEQLRKPVAGDKAGVFEFVSDSGVAVE